MTDTTNTASLVPAAEPVPAYVTRLQKLGIPENYGDRLELAYRMAQALIEADMVPDALILFEKNLAGARVKGSGSKIDAKATAARIVIAIMKGFDVGYPPMTSVPTIAVINNKAALYGDGASGLINASGVLEYQRVETTGSWEKKDYVATVTMKRRDQTLPIVRSFSYKDAQLAGLIGKTGPWTTYPTRQCYWRAWSWAARDCCSDVLMGLTIAEEVRDIQVEELRHRVVDTSSLGPKPAQISQSLAPVMDVTASKSEPEKVNTEKPSETGLTEGKAEPAPTTQPDAPSPDDDLASIGQVQVFKPCPSCAGAGRKKDSLGDAECITCGGSGEVPA